MNKVSMEYIDITNIKPNAWNPNTESAFVKGKLKDSIDEFGMIDPVHVREIEDGYELIGGQHRLEQALALGLKELPIINLGKVSDTRAKRIGEYLNIHGEQDAIKVSELVQSLLGEYEIEDLFSALPYAEDDLQNILDFLDFSDSDSIIESEEPEEESEWVTIQFVIPRKIKPIIDSEIDRIGGVIEFKPELDEKVRKGLILEAICLNSANTPLESIR